MLRPKSSSIEPHENGSNPTPEEFADGTSSGEATGTGSLDIQAELNRLEEIILNSLRIPLTRRTLVDEEKLLDQLDYVRLCLPTAFQEAATINEQKEEILLQAEEYGRQIVDAAQEKRAQILDESDILRQAEREAEQMRRQVQQECEAIMLETLEEIDRQRRQCQQELDQMQANAITEAEAIEQGADEYADSVLENIEQQLDDMLRIIQNGRKQLHLDSSPQNNSTPPKKK